MNETSFAKVADRMRRSKKRSKYYELSLMKYLKKLGWRYNTGLVFGVPTYKYFQYAGRRIPVSGPMFGWCDGFATKQIGEKLHIAFFQLKPRSTKAFCYFEKKQLISLCMLEELFIAPHVIVWKILVARLKRRWIFHEVLKEDLELIDKLSEQYGREALFRLNRNSTSTWNPRLSLPASSREHTAAT